jgi:hypothetical protein
MKNVEGRFLLAVLILLSVMVGYGYYKDKVIDKDYCYVIAKVDEVIDTENGISYKIHYYHSGQIYHSGIKGFINLFGDSLIAIKISKQQPRLWNYASSKIAACLKTKPNMMQNCWSYYSYCN